MIDALHVSVVEFVAILLATVIGATVQGTVGFGQNLVVVPVVALLVPEALPAALVFAGTPITIAMAVREHHGIDRRGLAWMTAGRVPGTLAGLVIVATLSTSALGALAGGVVLVAAVASAIAPPLQVTPAAALVTGTASGVFGTAAAIDGPPMALLYQHHPGPELRPTLAAAFVVGSVMTVSGLVLAGEVAGWQVALALALFPGIAAGFWLSRPVTRMLHGRSLRPAVLAVAGLTGVAALARGIAA